MARLPELRGKVLGCWCRPPCRCHATVLLALANRQVQTVKRKVSYCDCLRVGPDGKVPPLSSDEHFAMQGILYDVIARLERAEGLLNANETFYVKVRDLLQRHGRLGLTESIMGFR